MDYVITSEAVTEGHPDKVCDQISDGILDAYLRGDDNSRVAVECMISDGCLFISGEVSSKAKVDVEEIARQVLYRIGYSDYESGFDVKNSIYITDIVKQSPDIAVGVNRRRICAGDQGIMFGYAAAETSEYMPYGIYLAQKFAKRLSEVRKKNIIKDLLPDGKTQASIRYDSYGNVKHIDTIIIAQQHKKSLDEVTLKRMIAEHVIAPCVDARYFDEDTRIIINGTGAFIKGGPAADTGLTGRKIVVDTYGGYAHHGGGAFSGKDYSKADRSAAYMARYIAKNIVAAGLCKKVEIQLSYAIGLEECQSIFVNTFNTEVKKLDDIYKVVNSVFDTRINSIIDNFDLRHVCYSDTACYGHFGRSEFDFPWERLDKIAEIKSLI